MKRLRSPKDGLDSTAERRWLEGERKGGKEGTAPSISLTVGFTTGHPPAQSINCEKRYRYELVSYKGWVLYICLHIKYLPEWGNTLLGNFQDKALLLFCLNTATYCYYLYCFSPTFYHRHTKQNRKNKMNGDRWRAAQHFLKTGERGVLPHELLLHVLLIPSHHEATVQLANTLRHT